ncbi:MAG TPA: hypothetical protein VFZ51_00235 [Woeseiaceae bacterium]
MTGDRSFQDAQPAQVRLRSIINHTVFGFGLYISAPLTVMLVY